MTQSKTLDATRKSDASARKAIKLSEAEKAEHREFFDTVFTLLYNSWVPPRHAEDALESFQSGKSLTEIFHAYLQRPEFVSRMWYTRSDSEDLSVEDFATLAQLLTGESFEGDHLTYVTQQRAQGRSLDSLLREVMKSPPAQARIEGLERRGGLTKDEVSERRKLFRFVHENHLGTMLSDSEVDHFMAAAEESSLERVLLGIFESVTPKTAAQSVKVRAPILRRKRSA